jgi:hypothetical protein
MENETGTMRKSTSMAQQRWQEAWFGKACFFFGLFRSVGFALLLTLAFIFLCC